ncbi:hypothetical protein [Pseudomonas sp. NFACC08-1]|uniref:hypothetical protein n=1 Tax=Pseudomonas sp. NFACC08-1 TaxID=1566238 RepID=UPI001479A604|nr:hypothetical protein [Pseudomonas sp. NFACC08-1]
MSELERGCCAAQREQAPSPQKLKSSKAQKHKSTKAQKHKSTKAQKLKNSKTQKLKNSKTQKLKNSKTSRSTNRLALEIDTDSRHSLNPRRAQSPWRGSLLPLGRAAALESGDAVDQVD